MSRRTFAEVEAEARSSERERVLTEVSRILTKLNAAHLVDAVRERMQQTKAVD